MNGINQLVHAGDTYTLDAGAGAKRVHVRYLGYGAGQHLYRVAVTGSGPAPASVGDDDRSYPSQAQADHYAAQLVELLTVEQNGVDTDALAAAVNADWDTRDKQTITDRANVDADVAKVMANSRGFRHLGDTAPSGQRTAAATSDPMDQIITTAAHGNGRIIRGGNTEDGQATSTQLIALHKRGLAHPTYGMRGNQRVITGAWLTAKGWKHAGVAPKNTTAITEGVTA